MLKKKNQFFYIMLVLCAGYTVSQFLRTSIGVLSPNLMIGFNINPNDMGLLGGVFFLSFAIFQIPAGILIAGSYRHLTLPSTPDVWKWVVLWSVESKEY